MQAQDTLSQGKLLPALDAQKHLETLKAGVAAATDLDWLFEEVRLEDLTTYPGMVLPSVNKSVQGTWTYTMC